MSKLKKLFFLVSAIFLIGGIFSLVLGLFSKSKIEADNEFSFNKKRVGEIFLLENNTLLTPILSTNYSKEPKIVKKIKALVTAYSSSPQETDEDPFITASGQRVRKGIVANNFFPFGTKVRFPQLFGEKIFIVQDRMSWKKGNYHFDIWFPLKEQALKFGKKVTIAEILE